MFHTSWYDHCAWSPWIQPSGYHRSSRTIDVFWPLYCLYQLLQKYSITTTTKLQRLKWSVPKLIYRICSYVWIHYVVSFGLEQEDGSLITPMGLGHPFHPIRRRSRNGCRNLWVGWYVSSWWRWSWFVYSIYCHIHTMHYSYIPNDWNTLF